MKKGWEVRSLKEICKFQGGTQPPKSQFVDTQRDGYVRLLQIRDFKSDDRAVYIPDNGKIKKCNADDIMIGRYGASVGQIHRGKSGAYNVALIKTIPDESRIVRDYFYYYLTSELFQKPLLQKSSRGAQNGFNQGDIGPFAVPLPPLEEQRRIVAVLDEAFEGLARARANAEANLQNARELFSCWLEHGLRGETMYANALLGDHVDLLTGFAFKSAGYTEAEDSITLIRGDNIMQGYFRWEGVKRWSLSESAEYAKYELAADDVLVAMDRTWVQAGIKYAVIEEMNLPALLVQRVARLRCLESVHPQYLALLIGSKLFEKYVLSIQTGLGVPHVSGGQLSAFEFPLPSMTAQVEFVKRASSLKREHDALVTRYLDSTCRLDQLKQSLLQKAFAGELT